MYSLNRSFATALLFCLPPCALTAAQIIGSVLDGNGTPLPGAAVVWLQRPAVSGTKISIAGSTVANELGQYQIAVPATGTYVLCATDRDHRQVSSCEWRRNQTVVQLEQEGTFTRDITLTNGVNVRIQIHDPGSVLKTGAKLTVIASGADGSFAHARELSAGPGLRELAVTLPARTQALLGIDSPVPLFGAGGEAIPLRVPVVPIASTAQPEVTIVLFAK